MFERDNLHMPHSEPMTPLSLNEVVKLFDAAPFPWWIAGGWGIDLFLGIETRPHEDVDVLVLRRDQEGLRSHLDNWDLHVADPPGKGSLRRWPRGEWLQLPIHEIWCRSTPDIAWQLEVILGETDNGNWIYRRDPSVTLPVDSLGGTAAEGIPYIAPEVLLLFKAKPLRSKDLGDFDEVIDQLDPSAKAWLRHALAAAHPGHKWIDRL